MDKDLALLHQKLDYLTEQLEAQNKQKEGMNELMQCHPCRQSHDQAFDR